MEEIDLSPPRRFLLDAPRRPPRDHHWLLQRDRQVLRDEMAQEGADVCINYYSEHEADAAREVLSQVEGSGRRAIAVQADVGSEHDVIRMVGAARDAFGGVDVLVNNAGIEKQVETMEMSLDEWEWVLRTNLTGSFLGMRECTKLMKDRGGVIVNMSSVQQFIPWPGFAHQCASKGGMKLLTETAARGWAPHKIRLVNVAPGAIATPIMTGNTLVVDGGMALYPKFV